MSTIVFDKSLKYWKVLPFWWFMFFILIHISSISKKFLRIWKNIVLMSWISETGILPSILGKQRVSFLPSVPVSLHQNTNPITASILTLKVMICSFILIFFPFSFSNCFNQYALCKLPQIFGRNKEVINESTYYKNAIHQGSI